MSHAMNAYFETERIWFIIDVGFSCMVGVYDSMPSILQK